MVLDVSSEMRCVNSGKSEVGANIPSSNCGGGYIWGIVWRFGDRGFFKRAWRLFEKKLIYQAIGAAGVLMLKALKFM